MSENNNMVRVKEVVEYNGHSISAKGVVNFSLKASYSELVNTIQLMQLLNNNINIMAKLPGKKPMAVGYFMIKQIIIDGDGESVIKFSSIVEHVEMPNLNLLPLANEESTEFVVLMVAEIEEDEGDE